MIVTQTPVISNPGERLTAWLYANGMTQAECARQMGYSAKHMSNFCAGRIRLTSTMAVALACLTGIPVRAWLRLEASHQEQRIGHR